MPSPSVFAASTPSAPPVLRGGVRAAHRWSVACAMLSACLWLTLAAAPVTAGPRIVDDGDGGGERGDTTTATAPDRGRGETTDGVDGRRAGQMIVARRMQDDRGLEFGLETGFYGADQDWLQRSQDGALWGGFAMLLRWRFAQPWSLRFAIGVNGRSSDGGDLEEARLIWDMGVLWYVWGNRFWQPFISTGLHGAAGTVSHHGRSSEYHELGPWGSIGNDILVGDWRFTSEFRIGGFFRDEDSGPILADPSRYTRTASDSRLAFQWTTGVLYRF